MEQLILGIMLAVTSLIIFFYIDDKLFQSQLKKLNTSYNETKLDVTIGDKKMTIKELCSKIAGLEGKKVQVSIGNVREIISVLCDLIALDSEVLELLSKHSAKRAHRAKNPAKN